MKIFLLLIIIITSNISNAQTYYNPQNTLKLTVEIKEPYKPVNWAEIGTNFSNSITAEIQRREILKKYYDDIFFQTRNSMNTNTLMTSDNEINSKLLLLQNASVERLEILNRLLKTGNLKPNDYENDLKETYYNYLSANQVFVNLSTYKTNKLNSLKIDAEINEFNKIFSLLITQVSGFKNSKGIKFSVLQKPQDDYDFSIFYNSLTSMADQGFKAYLDSKK